VFDSLPSRRGPAARDNLLFYALIGDAEAEVEIGKEDLPKKNKPGKPPPYKDKHSTKGNRPRLLIKGEE
jgi:hypothetical protein